MIKMKLISVFAILLLISSCAHNKIRYVRAPKHVVSVNHEDKTATVLENNDVIAHSENTLSEKATIEVVENDLATASNSYVDPNYKYLPSYTTPLLAPPDSTATMTTMEKQDLYYDAMDAEDNAKSARNVLAGAFVLLVIPFFGFFLSILLYAVGARYYKLAKDSRYNTARGIEYEEAARKWNIAYGVAMGLTLLLIVALILLILFF